MYTPFGNLDRSNCLFIFLLFSLKNPDFMFWMAVTLLLDPGGYLVIYLPRSMIGGLQIWDLKFILLLIPLISPNINIRFYFKFKYNVIILILLRNLLVKLFLVASHNG